MTHIRYIQLYRARKLKRRKTDPFYNARCSAWCYADDEYIHYDQYLDRLLQKFTNYEMKFHYRYNDKVVTHNTFTQVLEDMTTRYKKLSIVDFEKDYNQQQIEWLSIIKEKLQAGANMPPYDRYDKFTTVEDACEDLVLYNECYDYLVYKNQPAEDSWHDHRFTHVLARLIDMPEYFTVTGFENQYSRQQIELMEAVRKKLLPPPIITC